MPLGAHEPFRHSSARVSGKRVLLVIGILALLCGVALYAALLPLYLRGKESLRAAPDAPDAHQQSAP